MAPPRILQAEPSQRFGRWIVLREIPGGRHRQVECACDCGNVKTVTVEALAYGESTSCGCWHREATSARRRSHGLSGHPLFSLWQAMISRCHNPKSAGYATYGGRGIAVCAEWHDPATFITWIEMNLGPRPEDMTLDRWPDNNGNYEPGNVRWATGKQQAANKRPPRRKAPSQDLAKMELLRDASRSNNLIGHIVGCSGTAVRQARIKLEASGEIPRYAFRGGKGNTTGILASSPTAPRHNRPTLRKAAPADESPPTRA